MRAWILPLVAMLFTACAAAGDDDAAETEDALSSDASAAVRVADLAAVCPIARPSPLCSALRRAESGKGASAAAAYREAAGIIAARAKSERDAVLRDPVVHYYLRERAVALFLFAHVGGDAKKLPAALAEFYPAYRPSSFALAQAMVPPAAPACTRHETIVFSPGLFRIEKNELADPIAGLRAAFPCVDVVRVDQDNAAAPSDSGERIAEAVARLDPTEPVHFLGHSAGSASVLYALARHPAVAARARTVVSLQPVAHGTEIFDRLTPPFLRPEAFDELSVKTADAFWRTEGDKLPRTALYFTMRGIALDPAKNIPFSNRLFYEVLEAVDPTSPFNDMQVRLTRQPLGGPLAGVEVLSRVIEGNHYQWGLSSDDVPGVVMPAEMLDRIPRRAFFVGHYQALHEAGLFAVF